MVNERDKTLEDLQFAIQMEIDGKEYYLKASKESSNELGKQLLQSLAAEEDIHQRKFKEIYEAIRSKKAWPVTDFYLDEAKRPRTILAEETEKLGSKIEPLATELGAVEKAMEMENKTYDFYKSRIKAANYDAERDFYEALAAQERQHHMVLLDYYEYLKDPAGWFVKKERPSLDGS